MRRALCVAVLLIVSTAAVACDSSKAGTGPSSGGRTATAAGCPATALAEPIYGGASGVLDVTVGATGLAGFARVDARTGRVHAVCQGATLTSSVSPGGQLGFSGSVNDDFALTTEFSVLFGPHNYLPAPTRGDPAVVRTVVDVRSGARAQLGFTGWTILAVTRSGLLLERANLASTHAVTATDFCVLANVKDGVSSCRPVPGARGPGLALAGQDGRISWAPTRFVPARFGQLRGSAIAAGSGIVAFTQAAARGTATTGSGQFQTSIDRRVVMYRHATGSDLTWSVVGTAGSTSVTGAERVAEAPAIDAPGSGFLASADGTGLMFLLSDASAGAGVTLTSVRAGSARTTRLAIGQPAGGPRLTGESSLVSWPSIARETP
ncbi:hypothetical protein [uncultured Jatrophihabitans sp.]|uniref:hypothetical protein n=1 Tax=uncultured Jatrophihabitans sp. TaxID=1610747 RepID=UPI0035C9FDA2